MIPHLQQGSRLLQYALLIGLAWPAVLVAGPTDPSVNLTNGLADASFDEIVFHACRYATTPLKKHMKELARQELRRRGAESLRYLVSHAHIKNIWYSIYARELVEQIPGTDAIPVLLDLLASPRGEVRKLAAYLLGFYFAPENASRLLPLLEDDIAAAAAVRTLGKWQVRSAIPKIIRFLDDAAERRRVIACNALGDIRAAEAVPYLMKCLDDPIFTVREAAIRALARIGSAAEPAVVRELRHAEGQRRRSLIKLCAYLKSRRSLPLLRRIALTEDPLTSADAARAMATIDPEYLARYRVRIQNRLPRAPCFTALSAGFPPLEQRD